MLGVKIPGLPFVMPAGDGAKAIGSSNNIMSGGQTYPKADKPDCKDSLGYNDSPTTVAGQVFDFDLWNIDGILKKPCPLFEEECLHATGSHTSQNFDMDGYMYANCFIFSDHDKTPGKIK